MVHPARAIPLPIREREAVVERTTPVAQFRRREEPIDRDQMLVIPEALVLQLPAELAHRGVRERLAQLGSRKSLDAQVLDTDPIVVLDQADRQFVEEIPPLIGGPLVDASDPIPCLSPDYSYPGRSHHYQDSTGPQSQGAEMKSAISPSPEVWWRRCQCHRGATAGPIYPVADRAGGRGVTARLTCRK